MLYTVMLLSYAAARIVSVFTGNLTRFPLGSHTYGIIPRNLIIWSSSSIHCYSEYHSLSSFTS
ncbi:hypothetical protein Plhal703r1_c16g0077021 [Plasmopara halstedii]